MAGITQGWAGEVWLSTLGIRLPALEGTRIDAPENFRRETLVSNAVVPINTVVGLLYPRLTIPLLVTANWFAPAVLNALLGLPNRSEVAVNVPGGWYGAARTAPIGDLGSVGSVQIYDGAAAWQVDGVKGAALSLAGRQGQIVQAELSVWGAVINQLQSYLPATAPFIQAPARSQNCSHTLPKNPTGWRLVFQNQLVPNAPILAVGAPASAPYPAPREINCGAFNASASFTFQAHHAASQAPFADGAPFAFKIYPPGGALVTITITNPQWRGRWSPEFTRPRRLRALYADARGNPSGLSPVTIA